MTHTLITIRSQQHAAIDRRRNERASAVVWNYLRVPYVGALHAEWSAAEGPRRFFQVERERGEVLVWIGALHVIVTRWSRVIEERGATAMLPCLPAVPSLC